MSDQNPDFTLPDGLDEKGQEAHAIIVAYLTEHGLTRTETQAFYSPTEWHKRGEDYGRDSLLVVMYDGCAALKTAFSMDYCYEVVAATKGYPECYAHHTAMQAKLEAAGLRVEECTRWYCAIYAN